ncbi:cytochrome d ubiquinol oxidase subunit II [Balneolaceae bacterium ANBcel3]|nr:cytochrome d ubiquinol oxidase subunit II [Balneolaceae bacterium ANBcel3]
MDLQIIWFVLIAVLFIGYFFLEGFDFGVGILMPFVSKDETDRRVTINTIGPFWDANEVWLITAGGAMFAAFPHWYATLFSGFYLPLLLILLALIVRAVGFEFRSKLHHTWWRKTADHFIFWGSAVPAFLWGVAFTNIVMGLPIGSDMNFTGALLELLNPYALLGGVASLLLFTLHGAIFLSLRTTDELCERVEKVAKWLWLPVGIVLLIFAVSGYRYTVLFDEFGIIPGTLPMIAIVSFVAVYLFIRINRNGWAFAATGSTIVFGSIVVFQGLFPLVMPSTISEEYHLTIYNASSSDLTLTIMSVLALIFIPIILAYQGWSYWVFKERVTRDAIPKD